MAETEEAKTEKTAPAEVSEVAPTHSELPPPAGKVKATWKPAPVDDHAPTKYRPSSNASF